MGTTIQISMLNEDPKGTRRIKIDTKICMMFLILRSDLSILSDPKHEDFIEKLRSQTPTFYILLNDSNKSAYIGQTDNFTTRIKQHEREKDFWQKTLVFISTDNSFIEGRIVEYLEYLGIDEAKKAKSYSIGENKQHPAEPILSSTQRMNTKVFFEDIKYLTSFIGCDIFNNEKERATQQETKIKQQQTDISTKNAVSGDEARERKEEGKDKHLFYIKRRETKPERVCNATGFYEPELGKFTVLKGSMLALKDTPSSKRKRDRLKEHTSQQKDGKLCLNSDQTFKSPSGAAEFCTGSTVDGWEVWRDKEGRKLNEIYSKKDNLQSAQ